MKWIPVVVILFLVAVVGIATWLWRGPQQPPDVGKSGQQATERTPAQGTSAAGIVPTASLPLLDRCPEFQFVTSDETVMHFLGLSGRAVLITFTSPDFPPASQPAVRVQQALAAAIESPELAGDVLLLTLVPEQHVPRAQWHTWLEALQQNQAAGTLWGWVDEELAGSLLGWAVEQSASFRRESVTVVERASPHGNGTLTELSRYVLLVDPQGDLRGVYDVRSADWQQRIVHDCKTVLDERVLLVENQIDPRPVVRALIDPPWLESRRRRQVEAAASLEILCDFSVQDRRQESGIRFRHRIVDDAGRSLVTAHYDHGNGLLAADVDNDGWIDLYFINQVGPNELWRNRGDGTFENITQKAGVAVADRISVSGCFGDIDNDGDADLFVTTVRGGNLLFENDGRGVFRDISEAAGVDYVGHSSGALFFDFNRDGLLDLLVVNVGVYTKDEIREVANDRYTGNDPTIYRYYASNPDAFAAHLKPERAERSLLYRNLGGNRFEEVAEKVGLVETHWTGDASIVDFNRDGWLDLYFVCMQGHDEYYENREGTHFERKSRDLFPATPWGTMGIKVFDFDNDRLLDLFLTDMHTDMLKNLAPGEEKQKIPHDLVDLNVWATDGNHIMGNAFFHALPNGGFEEISDHINAEMYWPWGLSSGDFNADGYEDLFITASMNFPFRYATNVLLLNDRGKKFVDAEFLLGVEPRQYRRTAKPWFELDVEGKDARHPIALFMASRGRRVARAVVWGALGSRSSVVWDFDEDGDLDIVTNDFNSEPQLLMSDLAQRHPGQHYLKLKLIGKQSPRDPVGAVVRLTAGNVTQTKVLDTQSGYLSHCVLPLYFGLGENSQVERLEITWPSGKHQQIENIREVDRLFVVEED